MSFPVCTPYINESLMSVYIVFIEGYTIPSDIELVYIELLNAFDFRL